MINGLRVCLNYKHCDVGQGVALEHMSRCPPHSTDKAAKTFTKCRLPYMLVTLHNAWQRANGSSIDRRAGQQGRCTMMPVCPSAVPDGEAAGGDSQQRDTSGMMSSSSTCFRYVYKCCKWSRNHEVCKREQVNLLQSMSLFWSLARIAHALGWSRMHCDVYSFVLLQHFGRVRLPPDF